MNKIPTSPKIELFAISKLRLAFLSITTLGLYELYWFYRNWKALHPIDPSVRHPFWRTVFTIFYCYSLFKKLINTAKKLEYRTKDRPGILAAVYIALLLIGNSWGRTNNLDKTTDLVAMAIISLSFLPLLYVQNAIIFINNRQLKDKVRNFSLGELIVIVVGVALLSLSLYGILGTQATTLPTDLQVQADALKNKADSLHAQYENCASSLAQRYKTLDRTSQFAVDSYNADYDSCESIRVEQNNTVDEYDRLIGQ